MRLRGLLLESATQSMLLILGVWTVLLLVTFSMGALTHALLRRLDDTLAETPTVFEAIWLGFCAELALVQLYSCAFATATVASCLWGAVALMGVPFGVRILRWRLRQARELDWIGIGGLAAAVALIAVGIAYRASQAVTWGDSITTHVQQVKWIHTYAAVPGLANLNPKLGFDSSIFVFAAASSPGALYPNAAHWALSFVALVTSLDWIFAIAGARCARVWAFCALTLPFLLLRCSEVELPSFSSDLPMSLLGLAALRRLAELDLPLSFRPEAAQRREPLLLYVALSAAAVTAKASALIIVIGALAVLAYAIVRTPPARRLHVALASGAVPALLLLGMFARRIIITGWLFYPAPSGRIAVPWAVPRETVEDHYRWIKSWARMPGRLPDDVLHGPFFRWFVPWLERFRATNEFRILTFSLVLAWMVMMSRVLRRRVSAAVWIGVACSSASLAYWFAIAPDVRFGGMFFWATFAWLGVIVLSAIERPLPRKLATAATALFVAYSVSALDFPIPRAPDWTTLPPISVAPTKTVDADTGQAPPLILSVPLQNELCGETPLPCTPFPGHQRWRVPGKLDRGFLPR